MGSLRELIALRMWRCHHRQNLTALSSFAPLGFALTEGSIGP